MRVELSENTAALEGVWTNYGETPVEFRIARAGNPRFLQATDKAEGPYRKQIARGKLKTEKQIEIQCRAMAEGILLGWKNIDGPSGPLEFNADNAYLVLRHNSDIREFVFDFAVEQENFRQEEIGDTAKK
jgi:hypothetical protein